MKKSNDKILTILAISVIFVIAIAYAESFNACKMPGDSEYTPPPVPAGLGDSRDYNGRLTVFIVEKVSTRYTDFSGNQYNHGFLDYGYDADFILSPGDSLSVDYNWDADAAGFGDVDDTNLMAIAIVKNMSQGYPASSDTIGGSGAPFTAYYTEACAAATIDKQWPNVVNDEYTHSIFAEIGTVTWCPSCPTMNTNMHLIEWYYDYPMCYVEMVVDLNSTANSRMNGQFNLRWLPTTYFDDGNMIGVGGMGLGTIITFIDACGSREVPQYGFTITLNSISKGQFGGEINLRENNHPSVPSKPTGVVAGGINQECEYITGGATDPDDDPIYYQFMMGASVTEWIRPYNPAELCTLVYIWSETGNLDVMAKSKDKLGFESDWSTPLSVLIHSYIAGDANGDWTLNIFDITYIISYLYMNGPAPDPLDAGDANGSGLINIFDVTRLIAFLYLDGDPPAYPD